MNIKIFEKNKIFPVFEKLYLSLEFENTNNENKYRKTFHFPSPDEFAKSDLLQELKNNEASFLDIFPAALIFHFEMINKNLITKLINHKFINFRRDKYKYIIGICIHSIFVGLG